MSQPPSYPTVTISRSLYTLLVLFVASIFLTAASDFVTFAFGTGRVADAVALLLNGGAILAWACGLPALFRWMREPSEVKP